MFNVTGIVQESPAPASAPPVKVNKVFPADPDSVPPQAEIGSPVAVAPVSMAFRSSVNDSAETAADSAPVTMSNVRLTVPPGTALLANVLLNTTSAPAPTTKLSLSFRPVTLPPARVAVTGSVTSV